MGLVPRLHGLSGPCRSRIVKGLVHGRKLRDDHLDGLERKADLKRKEDGRKHDEADSRHQQHAVDEVGMHARRLLQNAERDHEARDHGRKHYAELAVAKKPRPVEDEIDLLVDVGALVSCTFGKGNLIHCDYGKVAFTFWRRSDDRAVRLVNVSRLMTRSESEESRVLKTLAFSGAPMTPEQKARHEALHAEMIERILNAPFEEVFRVEEVSDPAPARARIMASVICACCGEAVMESRSRRLGGKDYCIPCFRRLDDR